MGLKNNVNVVISNGLGRLPTGKDFYSGLIFQSATKPTGYGTDSIKRIYSLDEAEALGITVALFPVEHYQISEFFRVLTKLNSNAFLDAGFFPITLDAFDGTEITTMQVNANYELRHIGVFLIDTFVDAFATAANTKAQELDDLGAPTSIYLAADVADVSLLDLRANDVKWVTFVGLQDGNALGAALYTLKGYSIGAIGALMGLEAGSKVHERAGWVDKFDISGATELQELAMVDGTLISATTATEIDAITDAGVTIAIKRRTIGSFIYTDSMTGSIDTSDFTEQRFNQVIGKAKRGILVSVDPLLNSPIYVTPVTGAMQDMDIQRFKEAVLFPLNAMANDGEVTFDPSTGRLPADTVVIDPDQNILDNPLAITVNVTPVGSPSGITVNLSFKAN